jgi:hypothetical protein
MATADAPTSKRLHLRGVDKDTLPKVVRAIAASRPWRSACVEYARRTDYGERGHAGLSSAELAPVLRLILQAVEQNVTFGGEASIQDLAKLGCPAALLNVVEMQVKKASRRPQSSEGPPRTTTTPPGKSTTGPVTPPGKSTTGPAAESEGQKPRSSPAARLGRRPTTNPGRISRRPTGTGAGGQDVIGTVSANPTTMSVFSVRRVKLVNRTDVRAKFRIDGISGGEDASLFLDVLPNKQLLSQVRELELLEKRTFVPGGRLTELIERELGTSNAE